jgi:hypothetical protein
MAGNRVGPNRPALELLPSGLTLEMLINRLAEIGKLAQFNITKGEDRYQASVKRENSHAYWVSVTRSALDSTIRALGPQKGESWCKHLSLPEGYDFEAEEIIAARLVYMHHPESACVFIVEPGQEMPADGLCEEVSAEEYQSLQAHYSGEDFSHLI